MWTMHPVSDETTLRRSPLSMSEAQLRREVPEALRRTGLFSDQEIAVITNRVLEWRRQNQLAVIE